MEPEMRTQASDVNRYELEYRRTGRLLIILFLLWIPVMGLVMLAVVKLTPNSNWIFFFCGFSYMGVMLFVSVRRFVAYYNMRGQHSFWWFFRH